MTVADQVDIDAVAVAIGRDIVDATLDGAVILDIAGKLSELTPPEPLRPTIEAFS